MQVLVGTSGYGYKEWKGSFYPKDIKAGAMLRYYAERLGTVEINNTFYRMPSAELVQGWAEQVPEGFVFVLKGPQRITHMKRLRESGEPLRQFLDTAAVLGPMLGPVFFQLPPNFKKDLGRLRDFLALLPADPPAAFEFRHESWFDPEVYDALREKAAVLCAADTDESGDEGAPVVPTADWGYLRLRRADYDDAALRAWVQRVRTQPWTRCFVFFKHEDAGKGPALAARFLAAWNGAA
jgi:uncharacterized protein YecE (DUF72 family)